MFDAKRLNKIMNKRNITVKELMLGLHDKGHDVSQPSISNWLNGKSQPGSEKLTVLAKFFKVKADYFLK